MNMAIDIEILSISELNINLDKFYQSLFFYRQQFGPFNSGRVILDNNYSIIGEPLINNNQLVCCPNCTGHLFLDKRENLIKCTNLDCKFIIKPKIETIK